MKCNTVKLCKPGTHGSDRDIFTKNPQLAFRTWARDAAKSKTFFLIDKTGLKHDYIVEPNQTRELLPSQIEHYLGRWRCTAFGAVWLLSLVRRKNVSFSFADQVHWFQEVGGQRFKANPSNVLEVKDTRGELYTIPRFTPLSDQPRKAFHQWSHSMEHLLKTLFDRDEWDASWRELVDRETIRYAKEVKASSHDCEPIPCVISRDTYIPASDFTLTMPGSFHLDFDVSPDPSFPTAIHHRTQSPHPVPITTTLGKMPGVITEKSILARTDYEHIAVSSDMLDFDISDSQIE